MVIFTENDHVFFISISINQRKGEHKINIEPSGLGKQYDSIHTISLKNYACLNLYLKILFWKERNSCSPLIESFLVVEHLTDTLNNIYSFLLELDDVWLQHSLKHSLNNDVRRCGLVRGCFDQHPDVWRFFLSPISFYGSFVNLR